MKHTPRKQGRVFILVISAFSFLFWLSMLLFLTAIKFSPDKTEHSMVQNDTGAYITISLFIVVILVMSLDTLFGNYFLKRSFRKHLNK